MNPLNADGGADQRPGATLGGAVRLSVEIPIRVLSILAILVLTHRLGVLGFGEFTLTLGVGLVIAELADLGLSQGLVRHLVGGMVTARDIFTVKIQLTALTLGLGSVALAALSIVPGFDALTIGLCVIHYVAFSWIECVGSMLRAHGRIWAEAALLLLSRVVLVALIGLTGLSETPRLAATAYALAAGPGLLLGALLSAPHLSGSTRGSSSRAVLREALPLGLNALLSRLTVRVEVFVLRALDLATGLGLFAAALRIVESVLTLPAAFSAGTLPALTREGVARDGRPGAAQRMLGLLAWGGVPAAVGLFMRAPEVLELLGPGFGAAAPVARIFAATLALCVLNTGLHYVLVATARPQILPRFTAMRVGVGLLLAVLLIPRLEAVGGALGYAASEVFLLLILLRAAKSSVRVSVVRPVMASLLGATPMGFALWFGPRPLIWAIPLALIVYAATVALVFRYRPRSVGLE